MIFRWSIWGNGLSKNIGLLNYSVISFRKHFGADHQYIIYTDDPKLVTTQLEVIVNVRRFPQDKALPFCFPSVATWMKWCPSSRLDVNQTEFYIDSDVFLLKKPTEIISALSDERIKFIILDEFNGQDFQRGAMLDRCTSGTPFINAGLFIQKAGSSITKDLMLELQWWQGNVKQKDQTHHDEQGALAIALTKYYLSRELFVLPKNKYRIISKISNPNIKTLDSVTLFHATYPTHPAFYKFRSKLNGILADKQIKNPLK